MKGSWLRASAQLCVQQHHTSSIIWLHWEYLHHGNQQTLQTRVFFFSKEPTANHLLAHPWWQQAALSWSQWYFSDLVMVNMREEGLKTLTGCQDRSMGKGCMSVSGNWLCFRILEDFWSTDAQVRPQSYWIKSLGEGLKVSKCSQNDCGQWELAYGDLCCVSQDTKGTARWW